MSVLLSAALLLLAGPPDHSQGKALVQEMLRMRLSELLCYTGNGVFDNIQEPDIGTVQAQFDSAAFSREDDVLVIHGRILKRNSDGALEPAEETGILIGTFENYPQDRSFTTLFQFDVRRFWSPDSLGRFSVRTKVLPTDYLCFVTQTSDTLVELYYSDIYDLSALAK